MGFFGTHVMVCHWVCSSHCVENSYPAVEDKIFSDLLTLDLTDSEDIRITIIRNVETITPRT